MMGRGERERETGLRRFPCSCKFCALKVVPKFFFHSLPFLLLCSLASKRITYEEALFNDLIGFEQEEEMERGKKRREREWRQKTKMKTGSTGWDEEISALKGNEK